MSIGSKKIDKLGDNIQDSLFEFAEFDNKEAEKTGYSNYSYWKSTWNSFAKNKVAFFLLILVIGVLTFTIIQPFLPYQKSPTEIYLNAITNVQDKNVAPSSEFWFGTNSIGQDLWARIWSGTRTSLLIGFAVGIFEAIVGIFIGALWGYVRQLDVIITQIYNVIDNIPTTIILILMTYILRPSISTIIFALCLTGWLQMARFVRNQIIIIRDREYNLAKSFSLYIILPLSIYPFDSSNPIKVFVKTDLPEPDSPTIARLSPLYKSSEIPLIAFNTCPLSLKFTLISLTESITSLLSFASK
jgi:oligopeptide transport system permease protein